MTFVQILSALTGLTFCVYGVLCLAADEMRKEFERFGLAKFRVLTGTLEILGGIGLLVGLFWRPATLIASSGLAVLMLLGVGVRLRMRDSLTQTLPAFVLMIVNFHILLAT